MTKQDILPEDTQRSVGRNAQRNNILAGKLVADTIRSTLGPKGMDKMLVTQIGDVVVTNDGATILREIAIEHPAAKMIVEVAKTQEDEVGDGTTTAVIVAGELLKKAEMLLDQNIHPTVITKGYRLASQQALDVLDHIAQPIKAADTQQLLQIAKTAMTGKGAELAKESLAQLCVDAVKKIAQSESIDLDNIRIETHVGKQATDSELIDGILIDKSRVHSGMPKQVQDARILLYNAPIEIRDTETDAKISITNPNQMEAFLQQEEDMIKHLVDKIIATKATVVLCQKGIDDLAQHYLAKAGILAIRRVKKSDIEALSLATGGRILTNLNDATTVDLGSCGYISEVKVGEELKTYISKCPHKDVVSLLLYGGTEHSVAETGRAIEDALGDLSAALTVGKALGGAAAPEIEVAKRLHSYAQSLSGREQLAVIAFAEAVSSIPVTLAENAGLDPIDVVTALKAAHEKKQTWAGIDVSSGKIIDAWQEGILEPLKVKTQAIVSATEVANMILRIDDVIAASVSEQDNSSQF